MTPPRYWTRIALTLLIVSVGAGASTFTFRAGGPRRIGAAQPEQAIQGVDNCVVCHEKRKDDSVSLFKNSTHARMHRTCSSCHGGDPSTPEKSSAHGGRFIGQPSSNDVLAMCGGCHTTALAEFKTSRHFVERRGSARVDCVQCHGAHTVGSPARNFSFAYYCNGCHGLEYLPHLPEPLQKALSLSDDLRDAIRTLESSGRSLSADEITRRKELRRSLAEIVHPTDLKGGLEKAAALQEKTRDLTRIIERKQ